MQTLDRRRVRRLALARAGLLKPEWLGLPRRATGRGARARQAAHAYIDHFGYLQLDSISIAGARTQGIVLASRLEGYDTSLAEDLLSPGEPLFEYWGHEACWMPLAAYGLFEFRRRRYRRHPKWGTFVTDHPNEARQILDRIAHEPVRSADFEGSPDGMWQLPKLKIMLRALFLHGEIAIRRRKGFLRTYDHPERVFSQDVLEDVRPLDESLRFLLLKALDGHGWATTGTLAATWRLRNLRRPIEQALADLVDAGEIVACQAIDHSTRTHRAAGKSTATNGWIRPRDLDLAERLAKVRPRRDRGVLLSPFDPVLWDRDRVDRLFDFHQVLEIYKPAKDRIYGYYCLPVLAGERLVARVDLKANRCAGTLRVLSTTYEEQVENDQTAQAATASALERFGRAVGLGVQPDPNSDGNQAPSR